MTIEKKYITERTTAWRATDLDSQEKGTIENVETFGCSIFHIDSSPQESDRPLFSFTVGAYDTGAKAEFICIGLKESLTTSVLNAAADLQRDGVDLTTGRHSSLIGEVECEFRPVDPKWIEHLMGWAKWFYSGTDFPVLQVVYPDAQNRFPEDDGFNTYFDQPLLQPDAPMRRIETDFWAANDPESSLFDWKFPGSPHAITFLSQTVKDGEETVTYVSHDEDDDAWQFLGDLRDDGGGPVLVCLHHPIDKDPSLKELADLPVGWYAEREAPGQPWIRNPQPPKDETS
jgi:hypothetical protein